MGEKDITQKILADYNDVFADIINVLLFNGRQVVSPNKLVTDKPRSVYKADGASYKDELKKGTKRYPVISIVLYFGTEREWIYPNHLLDCMNIPRIIKKYVNDYVINIFNIAFLTNEQVQLFQSDFRIVADYFVQMRSNKHYVPSKETIKHVDEVLKLMNVLTGDTRFEEIQHTERKVSNMCEALDLAEKKGIAIGESRGEARGIKAMIETLNELNVSHEDTIIKLQDKFEITREKAEEFMNKYWI